MTQQCYCATLHSLNGDNAA